MYYLEMGPKAFTSDLHLRGKKKPNFQAPASSSQESDLFEYSSHSFNFLPFISTRLDPLHLLARPRLSSSY